MIHFIDFFLILLLFLPIASAITLCTNITKNVSEVAFGNYLSFLSGLLLSFFKSPKEVEQGLFFKLKRFLTTTALYQFTLLISYIAFLTTYAFTENDREIPKALSILSYLIYSFSGLLFLSRLCFSWGCWDDVIVNETDAGEMKLGFGAIFGIPIACLLTAMQALMIHHFPSNGYMLIFQWVSCFGIVFTIPLCCLASFSGKDYTKVLGSFIYMPFTFKSIFMLDILLFTYIV